MASVLIAGISNNSFPGNVAANITIPSTFASQCASGKPITSVQIHGTLTVGATCGPGKPPFSIYSMEPGTLCGQKYFPQDITTGPDGALWFTAQGKIGRMTTSGHMTLYPAPSREYVSSITAGPDGALWFTTDFGVGYSDPRICRMTTTGTVTNCYGVQGEFAPNNGKQIVSAPDGNLWFTANDGAPGIIGRLTPSGGVTYFGGSFSLSSGYVTDIAVGPDGNLWFPFPPNEVGRITTSGVITMFPTGKAFPQSITGGPDGNLWMMNNVGTVAKVSTSGSVAIVAQDSKIAMNAEAAGADGTLWFTGWGTNPVGNWPYVSVPILGRVTTSGQITTYSDPSLDDPTGITEGPDGAIWFASLRNDTVGRVAIK